MAEALHDSVITPVGALQVHWPGSGQAEGPPCANAGCCPVIIIIIIAVTDDSSNARTTGTIKSMYLFITRIGARVNMYLLCRENLNIFFRGAWHRSRKQKKERHGFPDYVMEKLYYVSRTIDAPNVTGLLNVVDYHHKNRDRSDSKESNCQALCPNYHANITRRRRYH